MSTPTGDDRPLLRVIRGGEPTAEELAALVTAVAAAAAAVDADDDPPPSRWNDRRAQLRRPLHPGPGAWVAAARR